MMLGGECDHAIPQTSTRLVVMTLDRPYSILITDDDRAARETLREIFEPVGFRTLLAESGEEAIDIVKDQDVHLALMDMHLPRISGLETMLLVRQIKGRAADDLDLGRAGRQPAPQGPLGECLLRAGQAGQPQRGHLRRDQGTREVLLIASILASVLMVAASAWAHDIPNAPRRSVDPGDCPPRPA